ncbi:MAG: replication restart helicase PriA, partial [Fusobacteriaceae bacterium]
MRYLNLYVSETNDIYTYLDEKNEFNPGDIVIVDFRNRERKAIVVSISLEESFDFKVNKIKRSVGENMSYGEKYVNLLLWMKGYYLSSYSNVFSFLNSKKIKIDYVKEFLLDENFLPETNEEKELIKYFKKRESIREIFIKKKYSEEQINKFIASGLLTFQEVAKESTKYIEGAEKNLEEKIENKITLTSQQKEIVEEIHKDSRKYHLIHGITGSGKTEIYIELLKRAYAEGNNSIFLVPEISLTPQIINRFHLEFGGELAVLHSKLTESEKNIQWELIGNGKKRVVLGVRSAIFAPIKNLQYIIIDEEHETTYKQDTNPRYNAKMVAIKRAELEGAKVILGSATPSVESYYYTEKGIFRLFKIERRFNNSQLPRIETVDMKQEENQFFSEKLLEKMRDVLIKGEQVVILINRKGYSTYIQCKDCGHVEECPHCSIKYSYYQRDNRLKCNYCGLSHKFTGKCTKCKGGNILHSGKGVEKIAEELERIFQLKVLRVDSEASKDKGFHKRMYEDFLAENYKIMVGTQMITKGFHFPNVTLVGVISADMSLSFPDFRSGERTFQLLTQVAGRAGRGDKPGEVIIQTYQPENHIFQDIINSDYETFYRKEIEDRKIL